jgi:hypothetical protein
LIHSRFNGQGLLLLPAPLARAPTQAPGDTLPSDAERQPQGMLASSEVAAGDMKIVVRFPALPIDATVAAAERVWRTPAEMGAEFPFEIWRLAEAPPSGVRFIAEADISCASPDQLGEGLLVGQLSIGFFDPRSGVASDEAQLSIGELQPSDDPARELRYTHATNRASAGSPVLDFKSGKLLGLHVGSQPDPSRPGFRQGYSYSLPLALNMARSKLADEAFHPPPLCQP